MKFEEFMFRKVEMWLVLLLVIAGFAAMILFGAAVLQTSENEENSGPAGRAALAIARIPTDFMRLLGSGVEFTRGGGIAGTNPQWLKTKRKQLYKTNGDYEDNGLLLVSAYDSDEKVGVVTLYDLRERKILHQWVPQLDEVWAAARSYVPGNNPDMIVAAKDHLTYRAQSPLLLEDGSLVIISGLGVLARIDRCGRPLWTSDHRYHHSIDRQGDRLIVPTILTGAENGHGFPIQDDGYAIVSLDDGTLMEKQSIYKVLTDNGLGHLIYGRNTHGDVVHLNDAEFVKESDGWVEEGDIMLSARHLSAVMLYRPSSGNLVWYKSGPWTAQHDIDYQGGGVFTLFGNDNNIQAESFDHGYSRAEGSRIYAYAPATGAVEPLLPRSRAAAKFDAFAEGVHRVLRNGDIFVENSIKGRLMRIDGESGKLKWNFAYTTNGRVGAASWSRYLYRDEIDLDWLEDVSCSVE